MKIRKNVLSTETLTKKEGIKMIKKCLAITLAALIVIFNVLPAHAFTSLKTPVQISASGNLVGLTVAFTSTVVAQGTTTPELTGGVTFATPLGLTNSGRALKITGGTNEAGARIVIYTDNDLNTAPDMVPTINPNTGIDGAGLVGRTNPALVAPLFWGTKSSANGDPNTSVVYTFTNPSAPVEGSTGNAVYIVDKRHTHSLTTVGGALDNATLYYFDGSAGPVNTNGDGLYPQYFGADLYNSATIHTDATKVSPSLYSSIATIAWDVVPFIDATTPANSSYVCQVPKLPTLAGGDTVTAKLTRFGSGTTDNYLYVNIGADFTGKPAQTYSTARLYVEILRD